MGKKSFGFSKGIIARYPSKINDDIADNRPVGGGIVIPKESSIFAKNHILYPMQTILNPPMRANSLGKFKCRGREWANVIVSLQILFSRADTNAFNLNQAFCSNPILVDVTEGSENTYKSTSGSTPIFRLGQQTARKASEFR